MKKTPIAISLILILCLAFVSCDNFNDSATKDTSIKVEYDFEREAMDNEFPFDNIIEKRNGYDIVAAGKYYGNDFENIKYYGSYYRIIDNYADFSELTQWGDRIDASVFDDSFILVLHSYKNYSVYYSHPEFQELNNRGQFWSFGIDTNTDKLNIFEEWLIGGSIPDIYGYTRPNPEDYKVVFPTEKQETIYLLIPKNELPNSISINGEVDLKVEISVLE